MAQPRWLTSEFAAGFEAVLQSPATAGVVHACVHHSTSRGECVPEAAGMLLGAEAMMNDTRQDLSHKRANDIRQDLGGEKPKASAPTWQRRLRLRLVFALWAWEASLAEVGNLKEWYGETVLPHRPPVRVKAGRVRNEKEKREMKCVGKKMCSQETLHQRKLHALRVQLAVHMTAALR